ncbi:MAG: hypothetical protein Q9227_002248 [Pyrenula ochraceoflavens]
MLLESSSLKQTRVRTVSLPRQRLRSVAKSLLDLAPRITEQNTGQHQITVVCISDTHNNTPQLPPGDILLHAGDLTEWGSFDEVQAQIDWISKQPHRHKVIVAGNHDVLFDQDFLDANHEDFPVRPGKTMKDLNWNGVIYLMNSAVTLDFYIGGATQTLKIYGCPYTPQKFRSAFQAPRDVDTWKGQIPKGTDILLTHGPPWGHLDGLRYGCQYLAREIARARPRLVVFGHIHVGAGREVIRFDRLRSAYERIVAADSGWEAIPTMLLMLLWLARPLVLFAPFHTPKMAAAPLNGSSPLLRLPVEVRDIIHRMVLGPASAKRPPVDGYSDYKFDLTLLLVNRQIHDEARHIFQRLHTFIKITTPWPEAQQHVALQGYVPMICTGPRASKFMSYHLLVTIDAPFYAQFGHQSESFVIHIDDLPTFCQMWQYSDLSHPGLNAHLRLTLHLQDPYTPSYSDPHLPRSLQTTLLEPFSKVKNLSSFTTQGPFLPSLLTNLKSSMAVPYPTPSACLQRATQLKDSGNALLLANDPQGAIALYEQAFLAIHIVVQGRRRSIWADAFFHTTLPTSDPNFPNGQNAHTLRLVLRVRLVANIIHAYNLLENWAEAHFWGMRTIEIMREATGPEGEDQVMHGFPAGNELGKIYYRTGLAARELGVEKEVVRGLMRVAQGYLPGNEKVRKEVVALAPKIL